MDSVTHALSGALVGASVSQLIMPEAWAGCVLAGAMAGSIPDLDFLAEWHSKVSAWKYHRILTHNIPFAFLLSLCLTLPASLWSGLPFEWMLLLCFSATALHLLLDVLTSFGTCLWYPFTNKRYSTRSHFIIDPCVSLISLYGLSSSTHWQSLLILMGYLALSLVAKAFIHRLTAKHLPNELSAANLRLEPAFLAPLRWLVIVEQDKGYAYCYQTLWWRSRWYFHVKQYEEFHALCQQHELMGLVLNTFDMPLYQLHQQDNESYLLVEDLKWRLEPGLRPLAFRVKLKHHKQSWQIVEAHQGSFFQRSNTRLFQPVPYWQPKK